VRGVPTLRVTHVFSGIAVADFASATGWYQQLFGRPPDIVPHATEAVWNLAHGGLVYVVGDTQRAGGGLVMLMVDDLDQTLGELAARGLQAGLVETMGSGARKATLTDPDGNRISFGQA